MKDNVAAFDLCYHIKGLTLEEYEEGWMWTYRKTESKEWHQCPLDAFIDFTKTVLAANDRLTGGDISYDED